MFQVRDAEELIAEVWLVIGQAIYGSLYPGMGEGFSAKLFFPPLPSEYNDADDRLHPWAYWGLGILDQGLCVPSTV